MIIVFIFQLLFKEFSELFILNKNSFIQPWRFLTAIFLHGSFAHLLFNSFALVLFGSILESLIGSRRFLRVFFVTGILANFFSINFYSSSLGASGAIFGVIGALIIIRPWMIVWAFGIPMPLIIAGVLWAAGDIIGLFIPSNVGNIAHLSGMFFGFVMGVLYRKRELREFKIKNKEIIDEKQIRKWEDGYLSL